MYSLLLYGKTNKTQVLFTVFEDVVFFMICIENVELFHFVQSSSDLQPYYHSYELIDDDR